MATQKTNPHSTIRGGLINVPDLTSPTQPPRHQPDTPRTKKQTKTRSDHQPAPSKQPTTTDEPPPAAAAPPVSPPDEPETDPPE